jgi:primosomal protein N' (replication factor Y)
MYYYRVAIATAKYHGKQLLTYASKQSLEPGTLIAAPLQRSKVHGFVVEETVKPDFTVKQLEILTESLSLLPVRSLKLFAWLSSYYPAPLGITTQLFLPSNFPKKIKGALEAKKILQPFINPSLPKLTADQQKALKKIDVPGSYVIHGETGSGKTRIYIELAKQSLQDNKSCIILTPEISLTSQLAQEFEKVFGTDQLTILHSQLTEATRRNIWLKVLSSDQPHIIIGPRSALFSPLKDIGLIVVDESHEFAYKQENAPHYHAVRVASKLAEIHNAQVVFGSATPSVSDYFIAAARKRPVIQLETIHKNKRQPAHVIDMRDKSQFSRSSHISTSLLKKIEETLAGKQQVLLFINRRGTARIILCENCGWQAVCPHCDLPLTYHHDNHTLRCHTCGITQAMKPSCPECGNADIILKSIGTKSVVAEMQKLFPSVRVERFDTDNKKGERVHELYDEIRSGKIDILVGTQMLAKGLDLPKLGLVGVINADASMYLPDFTAQERTYQLLYQVIGRVGRSSQASNTAAVIQTYSPDSPTIQAAAKRDWSTFYEAEIAERKTFLFPPFCHLLKISCKRVKSATAQSSAEKFAETLQKSGLHILIDGPAPAFHEKIQNKYVWQLIIKSKDRSELLKVIDLLPNDWSYDIDPINLL